MQNLSILYCIICNWFWSEHFKWILSSCCFSDCVWRTHPRDHLPQKLSRYHLLPRRWRYVNCNSVGGLQYRLHYPDLHYPDINPVFQDIQIIKIVLYNIVTRIFHCIEWILEHSSLLYNNESTVNVQYLSMLM